MTNQEHKLEVSYGNLQEFGWKVEITGDNKKRVWISFEDVPYLIEELQGAYAEIMEERDGD